MINNTHEALREQIKKKIEQPFLDRIMFIGDTIPASLMQDPRPKFVLLGVPQNLLDELLAIFDTATKELEREAEKYAVVKETQFEPHLFIGGYNHDPDLCPECIKPGTFAVIQTPPKPDKEQKL